MVFAAIGAVIVVMIGVLAIIVLSRMRRTNEISGLPDPSDSLYEKPRVVKLLGSDPPTRRRERRAP
jgi:hypothetical protein